MNCKKYIVVIACAAAVSAYAQTAEDSVQIDRTVVVEREFQPTVQQAGKIAVKPDVYEPQFEPTTPVYSSFSNPLSMDYTVRQLDFSTLNFCHREPMHGFMQAGVGHVNSLFNFNYRVTDSQMATRKKKSANDLVLDLHAHHLGQWGRKTISESNLGFDFSKQFRSIELYFGAEGGNDYFTRYGAYYDMAGDALTVKRFQDMDASAKQAIWTGNAHLGVKSLPNAPIKYEGQMGYESFIVPQYAIEHEVHTQGMFEWSSNYHRIGAELDIQNRLYSTQDTAIENKVKANHKIHIEPYYGYEGNRIHVHAGVNLDFSAGRGRIAGISPNVRFEADLTKNWLAAYVNATGYYEANGAYGEYKENRYRAMQCLFADTLSGTYAPIDLDFGFKIRPYATLLIDLHAGYNLTLDKHINVFGLNSTEVPYGQFEHDLQKQSIFRVGADLHYHFRDVIFVQAGGNYFIGKAMNALEGLQDSKGQNVLFDAPAWNARLRIDAKINQKWSLYSDNFFMGGQKACVLEGGSYVAKDMRPMLDLNLGIQYNVNKWLSVYAQLNNYLAWTNKLSYSTYYGYEAQRANCMFGLTWSF